MRAGTFLRELWYHLNRKKKKKIKIYRKMFYYSYLKFKLFILSK